MVNFKNTSFGEIRFLQPINGTGINLNSEIYIRNNSIYINNTNSGLNKTANITLYGLSTSLTNPSIIKNGVVCTDCTNFTSLNAGTVIFNVSSGGSYAIASGSSGLSIGGCQELGSSDIVYTLIQDVSTTGTCFNITANGITLDGAGHSVIGDDGTGDYGIYASGRNGLVIKNINISRFEIGVYLVSSSNNSLLVNVTVNSNSHGITLSAGLNHSIVNSTTNSNTNYGIYLLLSSNNTYIIDSYFENYSFETPGSLVNFKNSTAGEIRFTQPISGSGTNLSREVQIGRGFAIINASDNIGLNKSANITFYNLPNYDSAQILMDGVACSDCYNFTPLSGNVVFNVSGGGNYTISGGADVVNPLVTINVPQAGEYGVNSIVFNVSLSEPGNVNYSLNNGVRNISMVNSYGNTFIHTNSSIDDGNYAFNVYSSDIAGNVNRSENVSFTVASYPRIEFISPTKINGFYSNVNRIDINISANDSNLANITINLYDNLFNLVSSEHSTSSPFFKSTGGGVGEGIYYYNATATDNAGRTNSTETRNITIDLTYPLINVTSPVESEYNVNTVTINFTSSDLNGISSRWFSNGTANTTYDTVTSVILASGSYNFIFYSNDSAGNVNSTSVAFSISTGVPVINYNVSTEANGSYLARRNIIVGVNASDDELANITVGLFNITGLVNMSYTSSNSLYLNFTNLSDGTYYFNATATDTLGNKAVTSTRTVVLDNIKPLVTITLPTDATKTVSSFAINITLNEDGICEFSLNSGGTNTSLTNTYNRMFTGTKTGMASDTYVFNAYCNDTAGNRNNTEYVIFDVSVSSSSTSSSSSSGGGSGSGSGGGSGTSASSSTSSSGGTEWPSWDISEDTSSSTSSSTSSGGGSGSGRGGKTKVVQKENIIKKLIRVYIVEKLEPYTRF